MQNKIVKVFAPATIANIGAGFDVLGVALETPGDFVTAKRTLSNSFQFSLDTTLANIPISAEENIAAHVAMLMIKQLKPEFGIEMILHKMMPVGSGMGSSGASSVAAAMAVNALLKEPLSKKELLPFIIEGERKASGAPHADNVAPSLLGGGCIIRNEQPLDVISFSVHPELIWIVISPHITIKTAQARRVLPTDIPLNKVVRQMGNVSGLVLGLMQGNEDMIRHCMVDHIAEPVRAAFIPGFFEVKEAALKAGALGAGISGSGPAMFALTRSKEKAEQIATQMMAVLFRLTGIEAECFFSRSNTQGASIISEASDEI